MVIIVEVRICLNENGTVDYFGWDAVTEDYTEVLTPKEALSLLRKSTPFRLAIDDPEDLKYSHYETDPNDPQILMRV